MTFSLKMALLTASVFASITANASHAQEAGLPGGRAPVSQVLVGGAQLALDSDGTLFRQDNPGKGWHTIHQQWAGKAVELLGIPALTSAAGSGQPENYAAVLLRSTMALHWVSLDRGKTWKPSTLDDVRRNDVKWSGD